MNALVKKPGRYALGQNSGRTIALAAHRILEKSQAKLNTPRASAGERRSHFQICLHAACRQMQMAGIALPV
jgi:hypothetical protein